MSNELVREIKHNLCINCGDRCCCHGMKSCKDVNEYIYKRQKNLQWKLGTVL